MDLSSYFDSPPPPAALARATPEMRLGGSRGRSPVGALRFGALALDERTGAFSWRGRPLELPTDEWRLLLLLMRNAGRIVPFQQAARELHLPRAELEARYDALRARLAEAGVTTQPVRVEGLGYLLWRE